MFIRRLDDCPEFIAGDNSILRELLHPDKADLDLRYSFARAIVPKGNVPKAPIPGMEVVGVTRLEEALDAL